MFSLAQVAEGILEVKDQGSVLVPCVCDLYVMNLEGWHKFKQISH